MTTPQEAVNIIKVGYLQAKLAREEATSRWGFNYDDHLVWHCYKTWLLGRDIRSIRNAINVELIPACRMSAAWMVVVPYLERFLDETPARECHYMAQCGLCIQEGIDSPAQA